MSYTNNNNFLGIDVSEFHSLTEEILASKFKTSKTNIRNLSTLVYHLFLRRFADAVIEHQAYIVNNPGQFMGAIDAKYTLKNHRLDKSKISDYEIPIAIDSFVIQVDFLNLVDAWGAPLAKRAGLAINNKRNITKIAFMMVVADNKDGFRETLVWMFQNYKSFIFDEKRKQVIPEVEWT